MARVRVTVLLDIPDELLEGLTDEQKIEEICQHDYNMEFEECVENWEFLYN